MPQMQELAQEKSGPIIAVRCPALPIRHSVSDLPPTSGKAALTTLRPLMGMWSLSPCAYPLWRGRWLHARQRLPDAPAVPVYGHRRSTGELCDDAVWTWTVGPEGFECRQIDGSRSPGLAITPACGMYEVLSRLGCELHAPSAGQSRCAPAEIWRSPPPDDSPRPHAVA